MEEPFSGQAQWTHKQVSQMSELGFFRCWNNLSFITS